MNKEGNLGFRGKGDSGGKGLKVIKMLMNTLVNNIMNILINALNTFITI